MKFQVLLSGKNKKNIINSSSAENAHLIESTSHCSEVLGDVLLPIILISCYIKLDLFSKRLLSCEMINSRTQ